MSQASKIGCVFGIAGASALSFKYPFLALGLWTIGNASLLFHNWKQKDKDQTILFFGYSVLNVIGVINYII